MNWQEAIRCIDSGNSRIQCCVCVTDLWPTSRVVVVKSSTSCTLTAIGGSHFKTTVRAFESFRLPTRRTTGLYGEGTSRFFAWAYREWFFGS